MFPSSGLTAQTYEIVADCLVFAEFVDFGDLTALAYSIWDA